MKQLARFTSDRKNTTSAWLNSVVIVNQEGIFPSIASIRGLEERVPVEVRTAANLPMDL